MADDRRPAGRSQSQPQRDPSRSQPRKKPRRRSAAARAAGALLYVLLVIGASGVLATLGWVWACDLLGLNKEYVSTEIVINDDTDFNTLVDTLEADRKSVV